MKAVAPFTGAWIEIMAGIFHEDSRRNVAPFTGAWIEMVKDRIAHVEVRGRTLHGCVD